MDGDFSGFWAAAPFVWLGGLIAASIFYRRLHDKPIIPRLPRDALFKERRASGRSRKNIITSLGGASNCLLVAVTDTELIVTASFPFTLMFLPEFYGFDVRAPRSSIAGVEKRGSLFGMTISISFKGGDPAPLELRLRNADAFLRALDDEGRRRQR